MTLESMLQMVRSRTRYTNDDSMLTRELQSAMTWVWQRAYLTHPEVELTFETGGTFSSDTQTFDLAANVGTGTLYGVESFWLKGADATTYIPVVFMDITDPRFMGLDQVSPVQLIQPTFASMVNFDQIRFANTVPSGTLWRVDWIAKPRDFSLNTNCVTSVPEPLHEAIVERACSKVWRTLEDTRSTQADADARDLCSTGLKVLKRRQWSNKQMTSAYPRRNSGEWV